MSVSAAHFKELTNGYEKQSDGLWVHRGKLSVGPFGTVAADYTQPGDLSVNRAPAYPNTGAIYFGGMGAANYIHYDGTKWIFSPTLTSSALAAGAAQALIGVFSQAGAWSTTAVSVWQATTVSVQCTTQGGMLRIEYTCGFYNSVASAAFYHGIGVDAPTPTSLYWILTAHTTASGVLPVTGIGYVQPPPGVHTISVVAYNTTGTLGITATAAATLFVTEQRR